MVPFIENNITVMWSAASLGYSYVTLLQREGHSITELKIITVFQSHSVVKLTFPPPVTAFAALGEWESFLQRGKLDKGKQHM